MKIRLISKDLDPKASDYNHESYCDGCKHYDSGDFNKAKKAFSNAIEYWPEDAQAWFALGNCYIELSKPSKAEACYRRALDFSSNTEHSYVLYNLGNSLFDQAKFEEAIYCYQKVSAQSAVYRRAQINMERAINRKENHES